MKIHLVRHAKTEISSISGKDFDRKLMTKGIIQANVLGYFFQEHHIKVPTTYCSPSARTMETLSILQKISLESKIIYPDALYLGDRESYLSIIWDLKHGEDLLFVGHNDGISELACYLLDDDVRMKTGHYFCIEFDSKNWKESSRGTGKLIQDFRPSVHFPD